jgi:peroxiredoxin
MVSRANGTPSSTISRITTTKFLNALLVIAGIGLVVVSVILSIQNRSLKADAPDLTNIQEGKHLSRYLAAATLDSEFRPIRFSDSEANQTLLLTFSPSCPHCKANQPNWSIIADELRHRGGWRVLWVSRDPVDATRTYCEDNNIPSAETFADPTHRTWVSLSLVEVPVAMVINQGGVIQKLWQGELNPAIWTEVFDYLRVRPPTTPPLQK